MSSSCVAPAQATTGPHRVASVPGSVARFMKEQWPGWAEGQAHTQTLGGRGGWPCHPPGQYEDGASSASFCVDALNLCRDSAV